MREEREGRMSESGQTTGASARPKPAPLPRPLSSFIGRRAELEELGDLLCRTRLLTLAGAPGCGKTRLALELAAASGDRFPDGVAFVDLAPMRDPAGIPDAVAAALGLSAQSPFDLVRRIENAEVLLVIDNAEHLIEATGSLVNELLGDCASLRILVTSREHLNIDGEVRWAVEPLQLPPDSRHLEAHRSCDSVALFCARAAEQQPHFRLTASNASAVATICRRLDGIPLALELAAARVSALGLPQIADRIRDSVSLLTGARRNVVSRHRTIRAAIEWSHDLLDPRERMLFRRLAQFAGTFDLLAVEAVCADGDLPRDVVATTLAGLVNKSLLAVQPEPEGGVRYRILDVIKQYGRERLEEAAETEELAARHARHYAGIADEMSVVGGDFQSRVERITANYANIELALEWAGRESGSIEAAITEHLHWYWMLRGMLVVAQRHLESVLSRDDVGPSTLARLHLLASTVVYRAGDYAATSVHVERASVLTELAADIRLHVWITASQGLLAVQREDWGAADVLFRQLVDLAARLPEKSHDEPVRMHGWPPNRARHVMLARNNLAMTLLHLGRNDEALGEAELALEAADAVFERSISIGPILETCGRAYLALSRTMEARERFTAALRQAAANDADHFAISPLFGLARTAAAEADYAACLTFTAAARRAARASGTRWIESSDDRGKAIAAAESSSRAALGEDAAAVAWERGVGMDTRSALEFARGRTSGSRPQLSPREREIAQLVAQGLTDKEIARNLSISSRTVELHLARVRQKLGFRNRAEVAVWAVSGPARA